VDLAHLFGFMTQSSISTPSGSKSRFLSIFGYFFFTPEIDNAKKQEKPNYEKFFLLIIKPIKNYECTLYIGVLGGVMGEIF